MVLHRRHFKLRYLALLVCAACSAAAVNRPSAGAAAQGAVDELLAADRAFSTASARTDVTSGLSAMFADDVIVPGPNGTFAEGTAAAVSALRANPENATSRVDWVPIRGGLSADGQHGFTFGYMTLHKPESTRLPLKYLAYWVKGPSGWRVAAYKRSRASGAPPSLAPMAPALPTQALPVTADASLVDRYRESLRDAENTFSREAQSVGLGPAFAKFGSDDAINLGVDATFTVGSQAIGRAVGGPGPASPSPVAWGADKAIVASSGDLGVTFGVIRPNAPSADGAATGGASFFTIWRRKSPRDPWRYVAE